MAIPSKGKRRSEKNDFVIVNYKGQEKYGTIYIDGKLRK